MFTTVGIQIPDWKQMEIKHFSVRYSNSWFSKGRVIALVLTIQKLTTLNVHHLIRLQKDGH